MSEKTYAKTPHDSLATKRRAEDEVITDAANYAADAEGIEDARVHRETIDRDVENLLGRITVVLDEAA